MSEDLFPLLADGNSRMARSLRAKLQWRDRYGRWIKMGGGIKFKVRLSNGSTPSVNGTFVGAKSDTVGQVYVTDDPNGLKNGFYDVSSGNAQEILGSLDPEYLKQRDIALGKDVSGNTVGSRIDGDIPNINEIPFAEAPEGWTVTKRDANNNPTSFATEDGDYGYDLATWGYPMMWNKGSGTYTKVDGWPEGVALIDRIDKGEEVWGDANARAALQARKDMREKAGTQLPEATDEDRAKAKAAVKPFDDDGSLAELIDSGASAEAVSLALNRNEKFVANKAMSDDAQTKDVTSRAEKKARATQADILNKVERLSGGSANSADSDAPAGGATRGELEAKLAKLNEQYPKTTNAAALRRLDKQIEEVEAELENMPEAGADTPAAPSNGIDTDTHGVAKEGFIIPTGKKTDDISPEGVAKLIESERDYLTEGSGKRLIVDNESGTAEIYTSADTLDNAKAQAGGIGAPEFIDLTSGEVISNEKNVGAPEGNTNPDGIEDEAKAENGDGNAEVIDPADAPEYAKLDGKSRDELADAQEKLNSDREELKALAEKAPKGARALLETQIAELDKYESDISDRQDKLLFEERNKERKQAENDQDGNSGSEQSRGDDSGADAPVGDSGDGPDAGGDRTDTDGPADSGDGDSGSTDRESGDAGPDAPQAVAPLSREEKQAKLDKLYQRHAKAKNPDVLDTLDREIASLEAEIERDDSGAPDVEARLDDISEKLADIQEKLEPNSEPVEFNDEADGLLSVDLGGGYAAEPITDDTRKDLAELAESAFPDSGYASYIRDAKSGYVAIDSEGNFAGVLTTSATRDTLNIDKLYITPDAQNGGGRLGTRLMSTAAGDARESGRSLEIPESVTEAKEFYRKLGAITPGVDDDSVDIPGTEQIFTDEARDRLADVDVDDEASRTALVSETNTRLDRFIDSLSEQDRADFDEWRSRVDTSEDLDEDVISAFGDAQSDAARYTELARTAGLDEPEEFGRWVAFGGEQFDSVESAHSAFMKTRGGPEPTESASWAANPNRPTLEELENAPEGARLKRIHKQSFEEMTFQKAEGVWLREMADGSLSPVVQYDNPTFDSPRNFFVEVLENKAPEADAPEAPEEPKPWEESGRPAADVYDKLVNDFDDPEVQKSYEALTDAVIDQFLEMKAMGINMEFSQDDPYNNSAEMQNDVTQNKRLKVFADGGATLPDGHPMKRTVTIDGEEYVLNDVFRGVHDYFGHVVSADRGAVVSFGPKGEWEAWRTHRLTLPRESWMALWTETRGQNTWTNYANDNFDLPIADRPFAEQKVGIVPEDVYAADLIGTEPEAQAAPDAPTEPTILDPDGDLNEQIQAAIADGVEVQFQYTSNNGTKIRTVKPERLWNNPKQGHDVLSGTDTETGEARNFILNKIEAIDPADTSAKAIGDMSAEEIQAELDSYDFETADSAVRQRIFDLTMEQGWRSEAPGFGPVSESSLPREPSIVNAERANNRLLREKSFSGLTEGSPVRSDDNGEPHDSAAIFELEEREELPDARTEDVLPQNSGQIDDFAAPEEPVEFSGDGVTPTREPSALSDKISVSREAARRAEFGYQDKDEDYADEKFMPTQEQRDIIMAVLGENDVAVQALAGTGKALKDDEPVLTPDGWTEIGSLKVGDGVLGSDGKTHSVIGVYPQGVRPLYKFVFSDGTEIVADEEHRWALVNYFDRKTGRTRVMTTREIIDHGVTTPKGRAKWFVPVAAPAQFSEKEFPLDPWMLGALLGDGTLAPTTAFTTVDTEILEKATLVSSGLGVQMMRTPSDPITYRFKSVERTRPGHRGFYNPLTEALREVGLRTTGRVLKSEEKFIPEQYFFGSVEQRLELLRGLMDTDGTRCNANSAEFYSMSRGLAEGVVRLVQSLGGIARLKTKKPATLGGKTYGMSYRVYFTMPTDFVPFSLSRKADGWGEGARLEPFRTIQSISRVESAAATCISVDAPDKLFVVRGHVLTHNTSTLELMARRIQEEFPDKKILYIAFNKSVQEEAESRMPGNVESRTGDSLGWVGISKDLTKKRNNADALTLPRDIAANFEIRDTNFGGETSMDAEDIVRDLLQVINKFTISESDSIDSSHFRDLDLPFNERTKGWADEMWADINDKNGKLKFTNSHATKIWALTNPDLSKLGSGVRKPADIIFFDEAQDINPVMAKIVREQGIQKVYVGDGRQAIYGFRGAENELDNVDVDFTLPLTQSWRFGPEVAGYGNRYLSLIGSPLKIVGGGPNGEVLPAGTMNDPDAVLTRSNAGAVKAILEQIGLGRTVGASSKFKTDLQSLIQTVRWLNFRQGRKPRIHDDLQGYKSWDEVKRDVDRGKASAKVEMLYNLVENMGIDTLQTAVDALRNADKKENKDNKDMGGVDYKLGASGGLGEVQGKFGPVKLSYAITAGKDKELRLAVTNAFPIKDRLKEVGFRFNGDDKTWYLEGSADELRNAFSEFVENDSAPIDVVVSTAHKAKGLEWGRVKIGDDFRGPRTVTDENGDEITEWPSPEEIRLAYVAVTRAQGALDPGSLAWVEGYTDDSDERPDVPSRGLPGEDGYDETPAPEPEVSEAPTPEPAPEPETVETPEPTPEPEPVEEVAPEPEPTPEAVEAPTPEEEDDDLPDDINELEILAGKLERRIVNANPRQARVLENEITKIYDKIERLEDINAIQDAPAGDAPEPVAVPDGPDPDTTAVSESIVRAFAEGKDLSPEKAQGVNDLVESGEVEAAKDVLSREPNKANTATKTKPLPEYATPVRQDRARAPRDPLFEEEPNEVLRELKRDFPDHEQRDDGDIIVQTKTVNGREYNIVVRRTNREKFYAYAEEIDLATGKRRVIFLREGGKQNHSYKALMTQINKGQKIMAPALPKKTFDRKRTGILRLDKGEVIPTNPLDAYITGTDLPTSKNDVYNRVVAAIAQLVEDPNVARAVLEALATKNGFSAKLVDAVGASVLRNKIANAIDRPGFDAPTHVTYDGRVAEVGQWVDWTDTDRTIAQTDEFGNTIYGPDGKALNKPNPNYGKVFRGYIQRMIPRKETNKGGLYAYTDNVWAIFPEYNVSRGLKPAYQRLRTAAGLNIVPSQNAPATPAFFGPGRVEGAVAQAESFDVPVNGSVGTKPRATTPGKSAGWKKVELQTAEAGVWSVHPDSPTLRLPASKAQLVEVLDNADTVLDVRQNIEPGDMMITGLDGRLPEIVVNNVDVDGASVLTVGRFNGNSYEFRDISLTSGVEFTIFRPRPEDVDAANVSPSALRKALLAEMASKEMPAKLRGEVVAALAKDDISIEEFGNIAETLAALKDAPESNSVVPLKNVLEEVRNAAQSDPEIADAPGVADIGDALRAVDQDLSLDLPQNTPSSDKYEGAPVRKLRMEELNIGTPGDEDVEFVTSYGNIARAEVGDLMKYVAEVVLPDGEVSHQNVYFQITKAVHTKNVIKKVEGRIIVKGNLEDGAKVHRLAGVYVDNDGKGIQSLNIYSGFLANDGTIAVPDRGIFEDYFADADKLAAFRARPNRQVSVTEETKADDPEALAAEKRQVARIVEAYKEGARIDAARTPPVGGAIHRPGSAQFLTTANGMKLFTKGVGSDDDVINEILGMRVANALGLTDNHAASPEPYVVLMNLIEGRKGYEVGETRMEEIVGDMENRPDVIRMGVLDYITGNGDRNTGNYIVTADDVVVPIDHGELSWDGYHWSEFTTELLERIRSGNSPISSAELLRMKNQIGALRSEFIAHGYVRQWSDMMNHMNRLIDGVNGYAI